MPYPITPAKVKHDLLVLGSWPPPPNEHDGVLSRSYESNLPSTEAIIQKLEHYVHGDGMTEEEVKQLNLISHVYTYADAPEVPLGRMLIVVGFADTSLSLVRKLTSSDSLPSCIHKCTVAVKRADGKYRAYLKKQSDVTNSMAFTKLIRILKKEGAVAIVVCDKHGRFGIVCPMEPYHEGSASGEYCAEDFAADFYVGNIDEVKNLLTRRVATAAVAAATAPPPPAELSNGDLWQPPGADENHSDSFGGGQDETWSGGLWQPPGSDDTPSFSSGVMDFSTTESGVTGDGFGGWGSSDYGDATHAGHKRPRSDSCPDLEITDSKSTFHKDSGAAEADAFYSGLTRSLDTRADSRLFHMRAFNGWVKATQIAELDPRTKRTGKKSSSKASPLRVLDLACGKGGDLGKWTLHRRGIDNYVGIDVARGSLRDAAERARKMRDKLTRCTFTCADLGADVPGRLKSPRHKTMQKLLTWSLDSESPYEVGPPRFDMVRGGGIAPEDKFDVVSIQFAIHYMMSTKKRARRFFKTVSDLLDVGGNLIATTIDARVVLAHMMDLGLDLHFESGVGDLNKESNGGKEGHDENYATIKVGGGACILKFDRDIVRKIFSPPEGDSVTEADEHLFGLQYTFTLVEGSDHAAGVGEAVDLPEWLTPIPALKSLALEAGLELESADNFHEFYTTRKDPMVFPAAHSALYNMKVLNRNGSLSEEEWEISRMYVALKFRKVRESRMVLEDDESEEEDDEEEPAAKVVSGGPEAKTSEVPSAQDEVLSSPKAKKMFPMAMMKAKKAAGDEVWKSLSGDEKNRLTKVELLKML